MASPTVSVIMPAYNAERFVGEAIQSILDQTFTDFEFLIHDDGSTDGTLDILKSFAAQDDRIRLTYSENRGVFATRNAMMETARGEYFAVMDADDIALPDRFRKQVAFLEANPDHVVIGGQQEWMDEEGSVLGPLWAPLDHDTVDARNLCGHVSIGHPASMLRAEAVRQIGGYTGGFRSAGDIDLWLRMAEVGKVANLPDIVLRYRLVSGGISGAKSAQQIANARRAVETARARRGISGGEFDFQSWREGESTAERAAYARKLGWLAWRNGYRDSWRKYAVRAVRLAPLDMAAWKLLILGGVKRAPEAPRTAPGSS